MSEPLIRLSSQLYDFTLVSKVGLIEDLFILQSVLENLDLLLEFLYECLISDGLYPELFHLICSLVNLTFELVVKLVDQLTNEDFKGKTVKFLRGGLISQFVEKLSYRLEWHGSPRSLHNSSYLVVRQSLETETCSGS